MVEFWERHIDYQTLRSFLAEIDVDGRTMILDKLGLEPQASRSDAIETIIQRLFDDMDKNKVEL